MANRTPGVVGRCMKSILSVVLLVMMAFPAMAYMGPPPGTWAWANFPGYPRYGHTAVPLKDGRVLLVGGYDQAGYPLSVAEIYDPDREMGTRVSDMPVPRGNPAAALLPDGRVLIIGGRSGQPDRAELFDPAGGWFIPLPPLSVPRSEGTTATTLFDGTILIAGGDTSQSVLEVFNGNFFQTAGISPFPLRSPSVTALYGNTALIAGGEDTVQAGLFSGGGITSVPGFMQNRGPYPGFSATLLSNGRVLFAGGRPAPNGPDIATLEYYDPVTRTIQPAGMIIPRSYHSASLLPSGKVMFIGGDASGVSVQTFDPANFTTTPEASLPRPSARHAGVTLATGDPAFFGGNPPYGGYPFGDGFRFVTREGGFEKLSNFFPPFLGGGAALLHDGRVLVVAQGTFSAVDPYSGYGSSLGPNPGNMSGFSVTVLDDGKVLIAGGEPDKTAASIFDPASGAMTPTAPMPFPRSGHAARLLPSGKVLVTGGGTGPVPVVLYDPASGSWTAGQSVPPPRSGSDLSAILQFDGSALLAGGGGPGSEIYYPASDNLVFNGPSWYLNFNFGGSGIGSAAALTAEEKVLHSGGEITPPSPPPTPYTPFPFTGNAALWHSYMKTETPIGPLRVPRAYHSAVTLTNGDVLILGGRDAYGALTNVGELHENRSQAPFISSVFPGHALPGALITLRGGQICGSTLNLTGRTIPVMSCTPGPFGDEAVLQVPAGATSGPIGAWNSYGYSEYPFEVDELADLAVPIFQMTGFSNPGPGTSQPVQGSVVIFSATIANNGPGIAKEAKATVTSTEPIFAISASAGTCQPNPGDNVFSTVCTMGNMSPATSVTFQYDVRVNTAGPASLTSEVSASSKVADPVTGNNRSNLTIPIENIPPVVDSLSATPSSGDTPLPVTFAAAAHDADGQVVSYEWTFGDNTAPATTSTSTVSHTYAVPGAFTATVKATDNRGGVGFDNVRGIVTVMVTAPNIPPVVDLLTASPNIGEAPVTVVFSATAHDPDGQIVTYDWTYGDGTPTVRTTVPTSSHTYTGGGTFFPTVKVTDNRGGISFLDNTRLITVVVAAPAPPVSVITSPSANATVSGASFTITGTATDAASGVRLVEASIDGGTSWYTATGTTNWSYTWSLPASGTFTIRSRGTDYAGNVESPGPGVSVTVDNIPPVGAIAINGGATYTSSASVTLTLSATDAGGVTQMKFSNDGSSWTAPEDYSTTKNWTLPAGDGTKTVFVMFKDAAGNWSIASSDTIILDTKAPAIVSTDPANNATSVPTNKLIKITFGENVQAGASYGSITLKKGNTVVASTKAISGAILTITPGAPMSRNAKYTVTIPAGALKDLAGNALAAQKVISFTTAR